MKKLFAINVKYGLLAFILIGACAWISVKNQKVKTPIVVVVNPDNPIGNLSVGEVKLYWLRKIKKRWPEINKNIKPADRKNKCPEQEVFYENILGMSAPDVEAYFLQRQYESSEKPQDKFASDNDIIEFVASEPGAIGFINKNAVNAKVKVVFTLE